MSAPKIVKLKRPFLVFKGGGYDGCFWRWDIFDIQDEEVAGDPKLQGYYSKRFVETWKRSPLSAIREAIKDKGMLVRDTLEWITFCREFNAGFVRSTGRYYDLSVLCGRCAQLTDPDSLFGIAYKGDGGVGIQVDKCVCCDCYHDVCQESLDDDWKISTVKYRLSRIKEHNASQMSDSKVSIFAARRSECPVSIYALDYFLETY